MRLEGLTRKTRTLPQGYHLTAGELDFLPLLENLADCGNPEYGAELFHGTLLDGLTEWVTAAAGRENIGTVVLCGGCFLNAHLAGLLPQRLAAAGLRVLQARVMPPNDGAISLGQAWVAQRTD
jgi:hydrogenase maturation protein HypF